MAEQKPFIYKRATIDHEIGISTIERRITMDSILMHRVECFEATQLYATRMVVSHWMEEWLDAVADAAVSHKGQNDDGGFRIAELFGMRVDIVDARYHWMEPYRLGAVEPAEDEVIAQWWYGSGPGAAPMRLQEAARTILAALTPDQQKAFRDILREMDARAREQALRSFRLRVLGELKDAGEWDVLDYACGAWGIPIP